MSFGIAVSVGRRSAGMPGRNCWYPFSISRRLGYACLGSSPPWSHARNTPCSRCETTYLSKWLPCALYRASASSRNPF
eukprot:8112795-Lingulodinium_polyedra.AAC.1